MSLDDTILASDTLVEFHASFREKKRHTTFTLSLLEAYRLELTDLWRQVKTAYTSFVSNATTDEDLRESLSEVKAKYQCSSDTYVTCLSEIIEFTKQLELRSAPSTAVFPPPSPISGEHLSIPSPNHSIKLPPCDTEIFHGNYVEWPAFRDMFTAVYINHPKISPVQKLFHLRAKTKGDALNIINKFPLTDENFRLAWTALKDHFENKRVLVNNHLKVLLNQPPISFESAKAIKELQSSINDALLALKANDLEVDKWDAMVTYICSTRLPATTLALWEDSLKNPTDIPSWESMNTFLANRFRVLESVSELHPSNQPSRPTSQPKHPNPSVSRVRSHYTKVAPVCKLCQEHHPLRLCPDFLKMDVEAKRETVRKLKYCYNCLAVTHAVATCKSTNTCFKCQGKHHTLLHSTTTRPAQSTTSGIQSTPDISSNSFFSTTRSQALLATAIVRIHHHNCDFDLRALLDPGSEVSFIAEDIQTRLKLPTQPVQAQVSGMSSTLTASSSKLCSFTLCSKHDTEFALNVQALVLPKLTGKLPSISIELGDRQRTIGLSLADPFFNKSSRIDMLIGADLYPFIIRDGLRHNVLNSLMAQNTVFGWVLLGPLMPVSSPEVLSYPTVVSFFNEVTLEQDLQKFWRLEELPQTPILSSAEEFCETLFAESTYRDPSGRYVVRMPFKAEFSDQAKLGSSRAIAVSQFVRNESRLLNKPSLKKEYDSVLNEYRSLGHMQRTTPSENVSDTSFNSYYLPHHAVIKNPQPDWPSSNPSPADESLLEQRPIRVLVNQVPPDFETILGNFSSWHRAIRILAYIYRFIDSLRDATVRINCLTHTLSHQEILRTRDKLIRLTQQKYFSVEYQSLSRGQQLSTKSWLVSFNAFIDSNGLVRSHGRLSSSTLSFRERFPILLPYNCVFTRLFVSYIHQLSLHGEIQLMTRMIRSEYWIPRLKNLVKKSIRECQVCTRYKKRLLTQLMGTLPKERTTLSRPFTNTGIDFAGPFLIKTYFGRRCRLDKGYVCLFVCFSTRAIHLEAVSDLTAQAFRAAFTRFVARRGTPEQVFSDQGTNFVGSEKLLFQDCQKA